MDTLAKLNEITDVELQALLSHAMRYSLQHNVIAAQAEKQAQDLKGQPAQQALQAAAIHKDTANLLNLMVNKVLELMPAPAPPPAPKKPRKVK